MAVDLLRIELSVLWGFDGEGRVTGPDDLVLGVAADGVTAAVSPAVPDGLAAALLDRAGGNDPVGACLELLGPGATVSSWPSFLVPDGVSYELPGVTVLRPGDELRAPRPQNWEPEEWEDLLGGGAGAPWAMIVRDEEVVSVCHTPRRAPEGAEAGTWTREDHRGRGYAAATTAVWSWLLPGPRFYSTSAGNRSSQRVAARLGLTELGAIWKLNRPCGPPRSPGCGR
ncbi:MAG: GNAT family N-acetyltransferase [Nonomuraea sp.]|nr:GNAT family N-acetyltransferase [Nonomuraea sp.]